MIPLRPWEPLPLPTQYNAATALSELQEDRFVIRSEKADGNCLFAALARHTDTFGASVPAQSQRMRRVLLTAMRLEYVQNPEAFVIKNGEVSDLSDGGTVYEHVSWSDYFELMRETACYGGYQEMAAYTIYFKKNILVYKKNKSGELYQYANLLGTDSEPLVRLVWDGSHFNTLLAPRGP